MTDDPSSGLGRPTPQLDTQSLANKPMLSIQEAAALLGLSRQTVTRLFEHEKGVLILERPETLRKRKLRTIRIPRGVFDRVVRSLSN